MWVFSLDVGFARVDGQPGILDFRLKQLGPPGEASRHQCWISVHLASDIVPHLRGGGCWEPN